MRYLSLVCLWALLSCQSKSDASQPATSPPVAETPPVATKDTLAPPKKVTLPDSVRCYLFAQGQDSTWVSWQNLPNNRVKGTYDWYPYQKDGAYGDFEGKLEGDIATVMYAYTIEGSEQSQEMKFKLGENSIAEFQGELEDKNGVLMLKNPKKGEYSQIFKAIPCAKRDKFVQDMSGL